MGLPLLSANNILVQVAVRNLYAYSSGKTGEETMSGGAYTEHVCEERDSSTFARQTLD